MAFPRIFQRRKTAVRSDTVPLLLAPPRAAPAESLPLRVPDTLPAQEYQLYASDKDTTLDEMKEFAKVLDF